MSDKGLTKTTKFKITKWIMLSLSILSNSFVIFYSCLSDDVTQKWTRFVTNIFTNVVNDATSKDVKLIPPVSIETALLDGSDANNVLGYESNKIPLGCTKQLSSTILPVDASNKSVIYTVSDPSMVSLEQSGSTLNVTGMKTGDVRITATTHDGQLSSYFDIKIVDLVEPQIFDISLNSVNLQTHNPATLNVTVDGGPFENNELVNFRYYDTRKLTYFCDNTSVATVNSYGVISPLSTGTANITVSNSVGIEKSIAINVTDGSTPTPYSSLAISGDNVCYANDLIRDVTSHKNHYQLSIKDGEDELDPEDFIWKTSNELLAKVDKRGVLRGFRKSTTENEYTTVTATSKKTGQEATFDVAVKNQLPNEMYFYYVMNDKNVWNATEATVSNGDILTLNVTYDVKVTNATIEVANSDENIVSPSIQGSSIVLEFKNKGVVNLTITSRLKPELTRSIKFTVTNSGIINKEDFNNVKTSLRKTIGHAFVFTITQVFTLLTIFMFLFDKKWWLWPTLSLSCGLVLAIISEIIQRFVPGRNGSFTDVLIDFAGVTVGAISVMLVILIIKMSKSKNNKSKENH